MKSQIRATTLVSHLLLLATPVGAQQEFQDVQIQTVPVADGVYMLMGRGGNIGLSVGSDGAFVVDDQYAPLTEKIKAAIAAVTDQEVRFVINTHWHFDHTGGNENFGEAGALIVAHENVRERMSVDQFMEVLDRHVPAAPAIALPVITFTDAMTFHWNGDDIHVVHTQHAHTDGDALIHFRKANAIHMGDTYFHSRYPFIDVQAGGGIDGIIAAAEWVLRVADSDTKIMPGHGPLSSPDELREYRDMLMTIRDRVRGMINDGLSIDEVVASKPTQDLDERWGAQPDDFVRSVYQGMVRR
jgi:glyoxylase-like metal-dependent hydrolase (beta-lactamase superfamily II)